MYALLILVFLLAWAPCAGAVQPTEFSTMDLAAAAALQAAYDTSRYYEYGGVILLEAPGKYGVGAPDTEMAADHTSIDNDPADYVGKIVANYHTHPCLDGYMPSVFSPPDLVMARTLGRPSYIADLCTGDVHKWQPGDAYDNLESPFAPQLATGRIVGHIALESVYLPSRPSAQSWDQDNLHSLASKDCPAQYDAPDGNLRQCVPL